MSKAMQQAAMKVLYLVVWEWRNVGSITGWIQGWAEALKALILAYGGRIIH